MKIKDKPDFKTKPKPVTFAPKDTVRQALNIMCEKNIGSIIVLDDNQNVAGIVTERDMMIRVLGQNLDPDRTILSNIMSTDIKVANENDNLVDWMQVMSSKRFRHLPVIDQEGKLVNMMSQGDFVAHTFPDLYEALRKDIKGRLAKWFQGGLILFAVLTLVLVAFRL